MQYLESDPTTTRKQLAGHDDDADGVEDGVASTAAA